MTGTPLAISKVLEKKSGGFTKDAQLSQVSRFLKKVVLDLRNPFERNIDSTSQQEEVQCSFNIGKTNDT